MKRIVTYTSEVDGNITEEFDMKVDDEMTEEQITIKAYEEVLELLGYTVSVSDPDEDEDARIAEDEDDLPY